MPDTEQQQLDLSLKILEIETSTMWSDIEKRYRVLVQTWHPDRYSGKDNAYAQDRFIEINSAFKLLREYYRRSGTVPTLSSPKPVQSKSTIDSDVYIGTQYRTNSASEIDNKNHFVKVAALFAGLSLLVTLFWVLDVRITENNRERALILKTNNASKSQALNLETSQINDSESVQFELTNADSSILP